MLVKLQWEGYQLSIITVNFQQVLFSFLWTPKEQRLPLNWMYCLIVNFALLIVYTDKNKMFIQFVCFLYITNLIVPHNKNWGKYSFNPPPTTPPPVPGKGRGAQGELCPVGDDGQSGPAA